MTREQILKKAIEKAIENGFEDIISWDKLDMSIWKNAVEMKTYYQAISSHDFARAFFKDVELDECHYCGFSKYRHEHSEGTYLGRVPCYKYSQSTWITYLQQMVREEDPLKYLEKFL